MRYAILADTHGNLRALEAVLADARAHGAERIVVAGDLLTSGPKPQETLDLLRSEGALLIRGNGDDYMRSCLLGEGPAGWREGLQWASLRWTLDRVSSEGQTFLSNLPPQIVLDSGDAAAIRVTHGSPRSPSEFILPDHAEARDLFERAGSGALHERAMSPAEALDAIGEPLLICGHSHIPWQYRRDGRLVLNPGSVGAPIHGDPRACYALLGWDGQAWQAEQRAVAYDLEGLASDLAESGVLEACGPLGRAFGRDMLRGENSAYGYLLFARGLAQQQGLGSGATWPDAFWLSAEAAYLNCR